jgi:signal transduction histidine kinase
MNKQLQTLLGDSLAHYKGRRLKMALNAAQIALEFGVNEGAEDQDLLQAHLLLARIFNTNGKYQDDSSYFQKALHHVAEAQLRNAVLNDEVLSMETAIVCGKIHLNLGDFGYAERCFEKCKVEARQADNLDFTILSLAALGRLYLEKNELEAAVGQAEEALTLLKQHVRTNHLYLWSEVYQQLSQAYIRQQEYSKSLEMSQELLRFSRQSGEIEKEIIALRNIAVVCGVKSNYKIGMQYFLEALDKCESIGFRELITQIQINIGTLYAHLYNYEEAIKRYQSVLDEHSDILDDRTKTVIFNNLGNIYFTRDQHAQALSYFEQARNYAENHQFFEMEAYTLAQLTRSKIALNRLEEATAEAEQAQAIFEKLGEVNGIQINLINLGSLAFYHKDFDRAISLTQKAIEIAKKLKDDAAEIRGYKQLAQIFKETGDFQKAFKFQELYAEIQDEFARVQRNRQFLDLEIRHAIREKQKEIEQLTKENEFQSLLLQKTDQISRQNQELLRANEELRQFAYVASHDLKEPLRMIGSYTQIIQRLVSPHLDEKGKQYFDFVTDGAQRMNQLLDGLLKYATIGNASIEMENIHLNDVIKVSLANLKILIEEKKAIIRQDDLPEVKGNHSLLVQLFQNLIGNALKFTMTGTTPTIAISATEVESEWIISVQDNGIGISPEHQEKIFEIFQRLHSRSLYEGTGIGLAICQKIAQRLEGRIWVVSEEGQGATFYIGLPK